MAFELGTTLIGFGALGLLTLPFILDHRSRKRKEARFGEALRTLAQQHQCTLDEHEICGDHALGIDRARNGFFYFDRRKGNGQYIDLNTIRTCQAFKSARSVKGANGYETVERVELCFVHKEKDRADVRLELYREGPTGLNGELQFVDKWAALVNARLKRK